MINSANTLDFNLCTTNKNNNNSNEQADLLAPEMVPTGKFNSTHTIKIPQNDARTFSLYDGSLNGEYACFPVSTIVERTSETKEMQSQRTNISRSNERVRVQHLQTHTTLQNNPWKPSDFFNLSAETEMDVPNSRRSNTNTNTNTDTDTSNISNNVQNESAFISDVSKRRNKNNNDNIVPVYTVNVSHVGRRSATPIHRTEDQESAFRRIEDVHNYAKLREHSYYNGSSASSIHDDEEEDDEEEDEVPDNAADGGANHNRLFNKIPITQLRTYLAEEQVKLIRNEAEEQETHIDVETLQCNEKFEMETPIANVAPDHHARRPMNAFLIFCKRHRAIVKSKYKSLENRAITKILGDWWASLDLNDKKCFTNLAEQNKAAFFSANPNFKWYKLPAPSLRTHVTRPNNADQRSAVERELREELQSEAPNCNKLSMGRANLFKLADEAQMGELSALINGKSKITQGELQQALGETTEFLSVHMPHGLVQELNNEPKNDITACKRRLHSENSLSSNNSSEDDMSPRKTARSCKGKIYQELKNSGQIAAITKKTKPAKAQSFEQGDATLRSDFGCLNLVPNAASSVLLDGGVGAMQSDVIPGELHENASQKRRVVSESDTQAYDVANFDLEEKIKELPALSLEAYLQRKRNTKKKKKFSSSKKRNSNSTSSCKSSPATPPATPPKESAQSQPQPQLQPGPPAHAVTVAVAVGSQKRKARKESITRRDVSAIQNEVASIMPPAAAGYTTVNGGYYFNESTQALPQATITTSSIVAANWAMPSITETATDASATSSNANADQMRYAAGTFSSYGDHVSSTSDPLGLLAEVAAKRTELTN